MRGKVTFIEVHPHLNINKKKTVQARVSSVDWLSVDSRSYANELCIKQVLKKKHKTVTFRPFGKLGMTDRPTTTNQAADKPTDQPTKQQTKMRFQEGKFHSL